MRPAEDLLSELWFCDQSTHIFAAIREPRKTMDAKLLGIYRQRLDAANVKFRFAAWSLRQLHRLVADLEHGEFIYLDDGDRLRGSFFLEAFLVFMRAAVDTTISAYYAYFASKTDLDGLHDVLKQASKGPAEWMPERSRGFWAELAASADEEPPSWLHAMVGSDKGMSLRDMVVHRCAVEVDTCIDDWDRGRFCVRWGHNAVGPLDVALDSWFGKAGEVIDRIIGDIVDAEQSPRVLPAEPRS